jgi:hypothetical protein
MLNVRQQQVLHRRAELQLLHWRLRLRRLQRLVHVHAVQRW